MWRITFKISSKVMIRTFSPTLENAMAEEQKRMTAIWYFSGIIS